MLVWTESSDDGWRLIGRVGRYQARQIVASPDQHTCVTCAIRRGAFVRQGATKPIIRIREPAMHDRQYVEVGEVDHRETWLFGKDSTEQWYADNRLPLQPDFNESRAGLAPVSEVGLQRYTRLLFRSGFGRRKRVWVLDSLERNPLDSHPPRLGGADRPAALFGLAFSILLLALRAIPGPSRIVRRA